MYIDKNGASWFKGNLHTHTTTSDGRKTPAETLALYRENGYDFIALTDHWKYNEGGLDEATGILVLAGCEYNTGSTVQEGVYHIVSVAARHEPRMRDRKLYGQPTPQEIIDNIKIADGIAILAHPAWSLDDPTELSKLTKLDATEIYNTVSGQPWNIRPYSGGIVDRTFANGTRMKLVAADDAHFYNGDACVSYIMVKSKTCDADSLRTAILAGDFVATQGPLLQIRREGDKIIADTDTPVAELVFFSDLVYSNDRIYQNTDHAEYPLKRPETFVRCEARTASGQCAWSNPIWVG